MLPRDGIGILCSLNTNAEEAESVEKIDKKLLPANMTEIAKHIQVILRPKSDSSPPNTNKPPATNKPIKAIALAVGPDKDF